ncbi:alpha/beta hydrolase [Stappia sp. F7233]|uniref:Alpha/beta hydrolase n=1 Tax=Stappia albiluteola TaxID=2758565 RepID=A0A839AF80_9HYPH|nr:alpha/beta hydrolase [Stappia albiluteola]
MQTDLPELFPGFRAGLVEGEGAEIFCRIGGSGPPVLLLHGYPQSHAMWHPIAARLAAEFTVVAADLRGYGASSAPRGDDGHVLYSKRAMGADMVRMMERLGFQRFAVVGHDRGGRVAYRMGFDHPDRLTRVAVLDILPTYAYWARMDWRYGMRMYHWMFLAQPKPMPERLIAGDSIAYLEHTLASWTKAKDLSAFDPRALEHYRAFYRQEARIHAVCEDYRAGATVDMAQDTADREAGRKIKVPLLSIYGEAGFGGGERSPAEVWGEWAQEVEAVGVDAGHFLIEEAPQATYAALRPFLAKDIQ